MKIAALDIGSNSIHMVVVEAESGRDLRILDREKDMVRLGDSAFAQGRLSASVQARALSTIARFLHLARRRGVDAVIAAATSAVRESANGRQFLALVRRETGQHVALLGEHEEARLIYLAVRDAIELKGPPSLIVDVGGGSAETIVADATSMRFAASLPLGVLRLNAVFDGSRPFGTKRRERLRRHVRRLLEDTGRAARSARVRRVIGTAGTVNAMARLHLASSGAETDGDLPSVVRLLADEVKDLSERLLSLPLKKRERLPGMDPARADTLALGTVVIDEVLSAVGADEIRTCRAAVREGLILDYLATHPARPSARSTHDVRERSVRDAAARYGNTADHGEHVSALALALFEGTKRLHGLGDVEREMLHFGALLHDVGQHIEYRRHHKHSYYLVRNAELQGFDPDEVELLAVLARYHRKSAPKDDHDEWRSLAERLKPSARVLIGLLRAADGLDRGHAQEVTSLDVSVKKHAVVVMVHGKGTLDLDVLGAAGKADVLIEVLGRPVEFALAR